MARSTKLTDSPFVYEVHFDDNLSLWNENHFSLRLTNCLQKYQIIPEATAKYTARDGQHFGKEEIAKFFIFHGSPDITLSRVDKEVAVEVTMNQNIVVIDKEQDTNEDADDQEQDASDLEQDADKQQQWNADEQQWDVDEQEQDVGNQMRGKYAIVENKCQQVEISVINKILLPEEMSEVLGNVHKVLTENLLTKVDNSVILNTNEVCSGLFLSKVFGACHCKVTMPLINTNMETDEGILQYAEIRSYMHGQLAKHDLCCHLNLL